MKEAAVLQKKITDGIVRYFGKAGKQDAVVGLSGGIDSAVVLALLVKALGSEHVTALVMPNNGITKKSNTLDAENLAKERGVKCYIIPIDEFYHSYSRLPWQQNSIAKGNLNARIRATILYNFANSGGALVAGTGNKPEFWMGYFTKYGDAAADFFPIANLLKKQVRALAIHMKLPQVFLTKAPSAELWAGQEDEAEMGITYEDLDELIPLILKKGKVPQHKEKIARNIRKRMRETEHKRKSAEAMKI